MKRTYYNPVIKDTITFLQTAAESGNQVTEIEITLMPGGGNPLHFHRTYSETFIAIDGDLGLKLGGGRKKVLKPGESHCVAPMQLHSFFNPGNSEIKFKVQIHPGHTGFENSLKILCGLAADGLTNKKAIPKSMKHLAMIGEMSDMRLPGIIGLLTPVLKRVAKKARQRGEEKELIERYCK